MRSTSTDHGLEPLPAVSGLAVKHSTVGLVFAAIGAMLVSDDLIDILGVTAIVAGVLLFTNASVLDRREDDDELP